MYTYLFEVSPEAFGVMLALLEQLNLFVFCDLPWLSLSLCRRFSGEIGRPVLVGYYHFALTMLFV